jgi:hypothetical protein
MSEFFKIDGLLQQAVRPQSIGDQTDVLRILPVVRLDSAS